MTENTEIFKENYQSYCDQMAAVDFGEVTERLNILNKEEALHIPFFNHTYQVSAKGITDLSGKRPGYMACVILFQYVLLCPDCIHQDTQWVSFRDFKRKSHKTNMNFFSIETEHAIVKHFQGRLDVLTRACSKLDGCHHDVGISYDLSVQFDVLPRLSLLLLYNEKDEEFPAKCRVLFQKHAEFYLDPESLAMMSALLAGKLIRISKH